MPQTQGIPSHFPVIKRSPNSCWVWLYEIGKTLMLVVLFGSMNPLVAFAIYLGFWHSVGHMLSEISYLKHQKNPHFSKGPIVHWRDLGTFVYHTAPFSTIVLTSMTLAYWLTSGFHAVAYDDIHAWALFIISISILTGAHLWIVAAMHSLTIDLDPMKIRKMIENIAFT